MENNLISLEQIKALDVLSSCKQYADDGVGFLL